MIEKIALDIAQKLVSCKKNAYNTYFRLTNQGKNIIINKNEERSKLICC